MKNIKLFLVFVLFFCKTSPLLFAQTEAYLEYANRLFQAQQYREAIKPYQEVLILDKKHKEALYHMGISLMQIDRVVEAQVCFDNLNLIAPDEFEEFRFWIGKSYYYNTRFHESFEHLNKYTEQGTNKKLVKEAQNLLQFVKNGMQISKKKNTYKVEHINQQINSEKSEFGAIASSDGKRLIFTRQNMPFPHIPNRKKRGAKKEILISEMQLDDNWAEAKRINNQKTSSGYDVAVQLLDSDRRMLIYQDGDLKISQFKDGEWKIPKLIGKGINTPKTEKFACVYNNGNKIIFSSDHSKSRGLDLFQSTLQKDGSWSKPSPLSELNTSEDEDSPYITDNGKTLYFSSKGHNSIGGYDIFKSTYNPVAKKWSKPKNLGVPVNSVRDDLYFSVVGEVGYLTSNRPRGFGMEDIYRVYSFSKLYVSGKIIYRKSTKPCQECEVVFKSNKKKYETVTDSVGFYDIELPFHQPLQISVYKNNAVFYEENNTLVINPKRPKSQSRNYYIGYDPIRSNQVEISGNIEAKEDKTPLSASIKLIDISTGETVQTGKAQATGEYKIISDKKSTKYRLEVNQTGYFYATQKLDTDTALADKVRLDFTLEKLKIKQVFVLRDVFFESGSDILDENSFEELNRLVYFLQKNPSVKLEISGHTDNVGAQGANLRLSDQRAKAVQNYLVGKGINTSRLESIGYGDTRPIASNDDEEDGRELNRRIEIQIIEL